MKMKINLIPNKFKCYYCKKIVWPWQRQYLGLTNAHASCDADALLNKIEELHIKYPKYFTEEHIQNILNKMHLRYY